MSIEKFAEALPSPTADTSAAGDFRLQAPVEIQALLRELLDRQAQVTLSTPNGTVLRTRLCALEPAHSALAFDLPREAPEVPVLLRADEVSATAYLDQIRVQFELEGLVLLNGPGGAVLRAALPAQLHRFQRRQSFRVRPNTRTPQVVLQQTPGKPITTVPLRLRIVDLSAGGLALLLPAPGVSIWAPGDEIPVQVELSRDNHFPAALTLQHVHLDELPPGSEAPGITRLGCAWSRIDPLAERQLQLFIDQTQKLSRLLQRKPEQA